MKRSVWNGVASGWQNDSTLHNFNSMPRWPSIQRRRQGKENCQKVCSQIVLKCLYLSYIGRPDILWSVNKLARAVKTWTRACDKRLALLISYMHFTSEFQQCCHVGNTGQQCRVGLFQDSDFVGDLEDSKSTAGGILCMLGCYTYVPISLMCKTQTPVTRSSTESEIISLDASLRMDGIPALDLWNLVVEVLHYSTNQVQRNQERARGDLQHTKTFSKHTNTQTKTRIPMLILFPQTWNLLVPVPFFCIFEDNEAVIKMIIKGRSPTTRHVSRTQRELRWIGYLTELTWTPRSKSNMLTPTTNSQTYWQKVTSHVTSGTIFFVCSTSVISALLGVLKRCRKEFKKEQEKKGSWQSQDRRWTWFHRLQQAVPQRRVRVHRAARSIQSELEYYSMCGETCGWRFKSTWRKRRVLKRGNLM